MTSPWKGVSLIWEGPIAYHVFLTCSINVHKPMSVQNIFRIAVFFCHCSYVCMYVRMYVYDKQVSFWGWYNQNSGKPGWTKTTDGWFQLYLAFFRVRWYQPGKPRIWCIKRNTTTEVSGLKQNFRVSEAQSWNYSLMSLMWYIQSFKPSLKSECHGWYKLA